MGNLQCLHGLIIFQYFKGFQPEWCISTIYSVSGQEPSICELISVKLYIVKDSYSWEMIAKFCISYVE